MAIFALGPFSTGDEVERQGSREQLDKELAGFPWLVPVALACFVIVEQEGCLPLALRFRFRYNNIVDKSPR